MYSGEASLFRWSITSTEEITTKKCFESLESVKPSDILGHVTTCDFHFFRWSLYYRGGSSQEVRETFYFCMFHAKYRRVACIWIRQLLILMKVYSVLWHSLRCVGGCLQTNFGADNVIVMLVGEGGGGHDVRILMPHANVVCKLPCLALLYVCCTANLDFICPQLFEKATASCPFSCWFWTYFIVWRAAPGKFCEFWCCEMASESWHGTRILIHFTSARTEISVHRRFQAAWERREGATHASWLEFCLVFCLIVIQARTCGRRAQNLLVLRSPQLSLRPDRDIHAGMHGSVQTIRGLLAWKQMVGDPISQGIH